VREVWLAGSNDYGHVTQHGYGSDGVSEQLVKLDIKALRPVGYIDLTSHRCVPTSAIFLHIGSSRLTHSSSIAQSRRSSSCLLRSPVNSLGGNALILINVVDTSMGDRLWAGKASRYVTSHLGHQSPAGFVNGVLAFLARFRRGNMA